MSSQPTEGGAGGPAFERAILGLVVAPLQARGQGVAAQPDFANLMADCSLGTDALAERIGNHAPTVREFSATPNNGVTVAFRPGVDGRRPRPCGASEPDPVSASIRGGGASPMAARTDAWNRIAVTLPGSG